MLSFLEVAKRAETGPMSMIFTMKCASAAVLEAHSLKSTGPVTSMSSCSGGLVKVTMRRVVCGKPIRPMTLVPMPGMVHSGSGLT